MAGSLQSYCLCLAVAAIQKDLPGRDLFRICGGAPAAQGPTGMDLRHGGIVAAIYLAVSLGMLAFSLIPWLSFATTTIAFVAFLLMALGAGNMVSVYWPRRIDATMTRSQVISKAAAYTSLLSFIP